MCENKSPWFYVSVLLYDENDSFMKNYIKLWIWTKHENTMMPKWTHVGQTLQNHAS